MTLFINPTVPFSSEVHGGLQDGMVITVCGRVKNDADRFNLNLECDSDVVLQVNPRYSWLVNGYVVHNSRQNGSWGWEEWKKETPFPRGQMFTLQVLVTQEVYKIYANGKLFSEYKHRMPYFTVNRICVVGMVDLNLVSYHRVPTSAALPGSLMVPYKSIIYGGAQPGKCIVMQGIVHPQAKRFGFCLRHKTGVAFDCTSRFLENAVVFNSHEDGGWGEEERCGSMPFKRGQSFLIIISCRPESYVMYVDGKEAQTFNRRCNNQEEIDVLEINGDVQLNFVQA